MKIERAPMFLIISVLFLFCACKSESDKLTTRTATEDGYTYEYVPGDPSKTRIYTLENGLKVYLSVYKNEPRIQTAIPVKAGGKFDPAHSTGLAHYLEHMMFKGTSVFGTKDWEKEKILLDSIEHMFEHYRSLKDPAKRTAWYKKIDEVSKEASKHAIANEYDKMTAFLGYTETNAFTTEDMTVYMNNIPSNQLENFMEIESARFSRIVNRLFHTELEAVYEEKNQALDSDYSKAQEAMMRTMFTQHPYGTQTVIGTIEHLKNPSISDIKAYFDKYYIPNNIALCLAGDLNLTETIKLADQYFGKLEAKPLDEYKPVREPEITEIRETSVVGPDRERVLLGFRFGGTSSDDFIKLRLIDYMLNNFAAGLIDLNLVQKQKVLAAGSYVNDMNDYSIHTFWGEPREGQTLAEVKEQLLTQIELLRKGDFEDWLVPAVVKQFKMFETMRLEDNRWRCFEMVWAFTANMNWADYVSRLDKTEALTKEDIVNFANEKYKDNYVVVYKNHGEDPNKKEVEKPAITKLDLDRTNQSEFFQKIQARKAADIQPVFLDYKKDIRFSELNSGIPVLYKQNKESDLFEIYIRLETGTNDNPRIKHALDYLKYLGTGELSGDDLKKEFYKLGSSFYAYADPEFTTINISGLGESMEESIKLLENLLDDPRSDEKVLKNLISDAHKERSDAKKEKWRILYFGLANYAKYGPQSPFTNVLSNDEVNALSSEELIRLIKSLKHTEHRILYYGPLSQDKLIALLNTQHHVHEALSPVPQRKEFATLDTEQPKVFFTNYDMVQAEMFLQSRGPVYNAEIAPEVALFNEYFGAGMSSMVFQELREAQGLAYAVWSTYGTAPKAGENDYMMTYIGTQADKQKEALAALVHLLNNLPESEKSFENARKAVLKQIESTRVTKSQVLFNYLEAEKKKLDYDIRQDVYTRVKEMNFDDLKAFHSKYVKGKKYNIAVIGDRAKMNFAALGEYGEVKVLTLDEIFGYGDNTSVVLN